MVADPGRFSRAEIVFGRSPTSLPAPSWLKPWALRTFRSAWESWPGVEMRYCKGRLLLVDAIPTKVYLRIIPYWGYVKNIPFKVWDSF
jgi:hypothetical protein